MSTPPPEVDDLELSRRVAAGDRQAAEALVKRHAVRAMRMAVSVVGPCAEAADVAQEALLKALASLRAGEGVIPFGALVAVHSTRTGLDWLRARRRRERRENQAASAAQGSGGGEARTPEAAWSEELQLLRAELSQLPPEASEPLVLCYMEGLSAEETGLALGIPADACQQRLARARKELRQRLMRRGVILSAATLIDCLAQAAAEGHAHALGISTDDVAILVQNTLARAAETAPGATAPAAVNSVARGISWLLWAAAAALLLLASWMYVVLARK